MRVSVIGCGYLGAVHAASMAQLGHTVVGVDVDAAKVDLLASGTAPFYEPGLPELLREVGGGDRLAFGTDPAAVAGAAVHFLCVGTPQQHGEFRADLSHVEEAFAARLTGTGATLVWNPEFLREGFAVQDTLHPDRLVYGLPTDDDGVPTAEGDRARTILDEVYAAPLADGTPLVVTDYATAQLVKVAANSFLATKISFINAMAELCEAT